MSEHQQVKLREEAMAKARSNVRNICAELTAEREKSAGLETQLKLSQDESWVNWNSFTGKSAELDKILSALGCQFAGVDGALKEIEAKNAKLEEAERLEVRQSQFEVIAGRCSWLEGRRVELEALVAGLETILAGAEHANSCASWCKDHIEGQTHYETDAGEGCPEFHFRFRKCDCFKSIDPLKVGKAAMAITAQWSGKNYLREETGVDVRRSLRFGFPKLAGLLDALCECRNGEAVSFTRIDDLGAASTNSRNSIGHLARDLFGPVYPKDSK